VRGKIVKTATFALLVSILASVFATAPAFAQNTTVAAPTIIDPTLTPGYSFTIAITVHDVMGMLGYAFRLSYDPSVLQATSFATNDPFTEAWPSIIGDGYVDVSYSYPIPEYFGQDVPAEAEPYTMATITFTVLDYGFSPLSMSNVVVTNVFGGWTYPMLTQGWFSNVPATGVAVAFNAYLLSSRKLSAGGIETATEQIENIGMWTTKAIVRFAVVDLGGAVVAMAEQKVTITPGQVLRLSADFDTTGWELGDYRVRFTLEYATAYGWVLGAHGGLNGQTVKYKTFTLE